MGRRTAQNRRELAASHLMGLRGPRGPGAMDRRRFVKTAGGVFVSSSLLGCRGTVDALGLGMLRVTVSGLASDALAGGSAEARRVDGEAEPTAVTVEGNGVGEVELAPGQYSVSYVAPPGYDLGTSDNPVETSVTAGATADVAFGVSIAGATGTLRISIGGLGAALPDGGTARVTRPAAPQEPQVTIPIPASGVAEGSLLAGEYSVAYTPPSGYEVDVGTSNPVLIQLNEGETQEARFQVSAAAYAAPDLFGNASFESGWDGMNRGVVGLDPNPNVWSRSQEQAYAGLWSAKQHIQPGWTGDTERMCRTPSLGPQDHVFARYYIYYTAPYTMGGGSYFKYLSFWEASSKLGGLLVGDSGEVMTTWYDMAPFTSIPSGIGIPTVGVWHSIEVEFWLNGPTYPQARIWYDGRPIAGANPTGTSAFWDGDWLVMGNRINDTRKILYVGIAEQIGSEGQTSTLDLFIDRVAVSTQRIGP